MKLRVLLTEYPNDPYLNVAMDEALLLHSKYVPILRIWRNEKSVVLGILSSISDEVNLEMIKKYDVKLARRISGGGSVFHDMGNINYTFITSGQGGIDYLYGYLLRGTISAIENLVNDRVEVYNETDIAFKGYKISGNAGYINEDKYLLHGTLLVSSNLDILHKVLIIPPKNYRKKDINMIKYRVSNLSNLVKGDITYDEAIEAFIRGFSSLLRCDDYFFDDISDEELKLAMRLANEKYSKKEFIYKR
ncbi:lipoate--protein ligase family protein [Saccharolobus solfataricus]|uniref:Lipoate-protein ligase A (LplA-1) n=3 Tax=Saccharolobus solfataricus TaxID=2287 RepID=Q97U65_SACS2|nr:biotin/lipoate A/B protein ligase family protein [Saccharolobus solfataricus]AAK43257.1 Lipoate-protein ligase A (lplA-1) [Saccharolobus solfataricus P2]AKA73282.1 lipoate--protein ligase family protein [Saccharolobus solfataricus]AKA75981.1 lipoate--protein ligase family protein [Saccharolobus solfataricus]AKA78674.1 lipoate--protein ligase family protein [Saccharolobus solfataricus]AZF67748.1 lipoate--protein ligase family protein [Saccharolobus solfataricus]